jgi:hypothetical protein
MSREIISMSKDGLAAAVKYSKDLIAFNDSKEAEDFFSTYRTSLLEELERISAESGVFTPDYSVDSLDPLEKWYFDLYENDSFSSTGVTKETFEKMMEIYFGETAVRGSEEANWIVREFPFVKGKYELLVKKGLMSMSIVGKFQNLQNVQGNKRKNLMIRDFKKYFQPSKK